MAQSYCNDDEVTINGKAQQLEAWMYNPASDEDQRTEHRYSPNRPVSAETLAELGVLSWKIDVSIACEANPALDLIKKQRGYGYTEYITVAPGELANYEQCLQRFFTEHLHPYDESRLILEGSGFWDIRGYDGEWIRFRVGQGDMIVLPPGMYHRFTLDHTNYIRALLLYTEVPKRVDMIKPEAEELPARKEYVTSVLMNNFISSTLEDALENVNLAINNTSSMSSVLMNNYISSTLPDSVMNVLLINNTSSTLQDTLCDENVFKNKTTSTSTNGTTSTSPTNVHVYGDPNGPRIISTVG